MKNESGYRYFNRLIEQNCAGGKDRQCSWDARLEPVEGWTIDKDGFVVDCPEFEEGN